MLSVLLEFCAAARTPEERDSHHLGCMDIGNLLPLYRQDQMFHRELFITTSLVVNFVLQAFNSRVPRTSRATRQPELMPFQVLTLAPAKVC